MENEDLIGISYQKCHHPLVTIVSWVGEPLNQQVNADLLGPSRLNKIMSVFLSPPKLEVTGMNFKIQYSPQKKEVKKSPDQKEKLKLQG